MPTASACLARTSLEITLLSHLSKSSVSAPTNFQELISYLENIGDTEDYDLPSTTNISEESESPFEVSISPNQDSTVHYLSSKVKMLNNNK